MSVDLGTISASVELKLGGLTANAATATATMKGLSSTISQEGAKSVRSLSLLDNAFTKLASSEAGRKIGRDMTIAGGATVAALGAATKAAADFDQSLRNVDSIAHMTTAQFGQLHDSVLGLAKDPTIRQAPTDLAKGLYDVYSSGFQGKKALDILKVSAQGASAGMTDTATSSKALMAVLNSGVPGITSARQAMDVLFQEVNYGVNTFEELASSIGTSLPIAAKAGITLQELTAAIGVMTRQGISASESVTELQQFILHLINPGQQAAKVMDELGIKHGLAAVKAEGLSGAIQNVMEKTKGHEDSLSHLFPRIESFIGFLAIAKNSGHDFADALDQEKHAGDGVGQMMEALLRQNKGAAAQTEILKKRTAELAIKIGEDLLPYLIHLVDDTTKLIDKFESLPKPIQDGIIKFTALSAIVLTLGGGFLTAAKNLVVLRNGIAAAGLLGGAGSAAGAAGILGRLGLMSGPGGLITGAGAKTAFMGTAGIGGNLLGGGLLAAPFAYGAYKYNQYLGIENDRLNSEQRGNGVANMAPYINRMAAIRKAHPKDYAGRADYQAQQSLLHQMSGANQRGSAPVAATSDAGHAIAQAAFKRQLDGSARTFQHHCEGLAHATYNSVTSAYSRILDNSGGSAKSALAKFQAAGLARPYTPGMALPPGSLLYSNTLGAKGSSEGKYGHVQTIGPHGQRLDQYGINHFNPRNFQFYVPPPGMARKGKPGAGGPDPLTDEQKAQIKQQLADRAKFSRDIQDQLFEATHPEFANRKHKALRDYQDQVADPDATTATKQQSRKLYLANIQSINAEERKANSDHQKELLRQWKQYLQSQTQAMKEARDARLQILQEAAGRKERLAGLGADMADNTNALTQDPDEYGFAKQGEEAGKRLRERQKAIRANSALGPYGKNDIDPGTLLKQAQGEYDAAMAHIDQLRKDKGVKDKEATDAEAQRLQDKTARENEAADRARDKSERDFEETMRFEYEHQMISLAQYQAFLKAKLASMDEFEKDADGKDTPILTDNWKRVKGDLDSSGGQKKERAGQDPAAWLTDGMKTGFGDGLEHLHSLKTATKEWELETIKAILHVGAAWATAQLFGGKFGSGFSFGGKGKLDAAQAIPALAGGLSAGGSTLGNIHGINGAVGGAGSGAGGGIGNLLGLAASFLPGGGLLGSLFGGGKAGGIFGGLKKIFHFATGGLVPGTGFHDSVPALLTPGERVLTKAQQAGMGGGAPQIHINHHGNVYGAEGVSDMHADWAWQVSQQLATAVPGS